jgi:hypothetical protein
MSLEANESTSDLIRWTFTVNPEHSRAIEAHLDDLGADVWVRDESKFQVSWEEPETALDEVVEALWLIHGEPFDVTQEDFARTALHVLQPSEDEPALEAA